MERLKNDFLTELDELLGNHREKASILQEYDSYLDDFLTHHKLDDEKDLKNQVYSQFGTPEEIAEIWREELSVTPSNMKWLFIFINILFFIMGIILTIAYHLLDWHWLTFVWNQLTSIPILIALIYMLFWALLGYEIGRGFGHRGKRIMKKTFLLALIPNITLMILVVFRLIPHEWFHPLLEETFIGLCIFLTALLYPICLISYNWGKKASI